MSEYAGLVDRLRVLAPGLMNPRLSGDLGQRLAEAADAITALQTQLDAARHDLAIYERDVEKAHENIRELTEYISNWEPEFQQLSAENPKLRAELDAARRDAYNDVITEYEAAALVVSSQTEAAIYRRVVANVKAMRDAAIDAALQQQQLPK